MSCFLLAKATERKYFFLCKFLSYVSSEKGISLSEVFPRLFVYLVKTQTQKNNRNEFRMECVCILYTNLSHARMRG